ncbi:hypothetical protein DXG01_008405 [Tephrocybe rancida]|nr:hypothetical protein DXG01_008405 [Tephrocybe rancida]
MKLLFSFLCLALTSTFVHAKITPSELAENKAKGLRLISLKDGVDPVWKTKDETLDLARHGGNFFDVTEVYDPDAPLRTAPNKYGPYRPPTHQAAVKGIIGNLSLPNIQSSTNTLTEFKTRYLTEKGGVEASNWILKSVQDIISKYPSSGASAKPFVHSWNQHSVIATIPGVTEGPISIVGAHMDSFNSEDLTGRSPGADGDATGTASLIEAFRALLAAGFKPSRPVEFHWYSGQFVGNLGSLAVANSYKKAGTEVEAMLNIDATAYVKPGTSPVFGLPSNYVDSDLTEFLRLVIENYCGITYVETTECGYACADHASWSDLGYPTAFPAEGRWSDINPYIRTYVDTTSVRGFSWEHTFEFTKLVVGFIYEIGVGRNLGA